MSQPLLATKRITLNYEVNSVTHKARAYVSGSGVFISGTEAIDTRVTPSSMRWSDAADGMAAAIGNILPGTGIVGNAILEDLVSGVWVPVDTHATSIVTSGTVVLASQMTLVLNDSAFKKVRVTVLDAAIPLPYHNVSLPTASAALDTTVGEYGPAHAGTFAPYLWQKSRGNRFLAVGPLVGVTGDFNDKLRRRRGLS